jgi:hypothetical protein
MQRLIEAWPKKFYPNILFQYDNHIRAIEITKLTTTGYEEKELEQLPLTKPRGIAWNASGMHNIDPHRLSKNKWIAVIDGYEEYLISLITNFHSFMYYFTQL